MRIIGIVLIVVMMLAWLVCAIGSYRIGRRLKQQREETWKAAMQRSGKEVNIGKTSSWAFWLMCASFVLSMSCCIYFLMSEIK